MDSLMSVSGLASGVQWRDMIDQIMRLERRPATLLEAQIARAESRSAAWSLFRGRLSVLQQAASRLASGAAFDVFNARLAGYAEGASAPIAVSVGAGAAEGSYQVQVLSVATREKLGGAFFASATSALGIEGEFRVNGVVVRVQAGDSLQDIAARINAAGSGPGGAGVTASVISTGAGQHRLVLTSSSSGEAGIDLVDGASGVLRALGLVASGSTIKHATSAGARSDVFGSADGALAAQLGFASSPAGTVRIGGSAGFDVTLDLATMSLEDVAAAINDAAAQAGSGVRASVIETVTDGVSGYRLEIHGTTAFTDSETRVLESLGILRAERDAVAQEVRGGELRASGAQATTATRIVDLDGGAAAGDTLTLEGTRADGSRFTVSFQIGADTTLADLLDRLNAEDAFGGGARTATASLEDGRIVVRDDQGGESRLALRIIAHNESGGTLDFGEFDAAVRGYAREITRGADAEVLVDGAYIRRADNVISDVVPGLRIDLRYASPDQTIEVQVSRNLDAAVDAVRSFVEAYNEVVAFIEEQFALPPEGAEAKPLYGNTVLRSMRTQLQAAMQTVFSGEIAGGLQRLTDIGIEIDRTGRFQIKTEKLRATLESDPEAVRRLFGTHAIAEGDQLDFVRAGSSARPGTYAVEILQPATRATAVASFGGTYVDDGTPDRLILTEIGSGSSYSILLENGMTAEEIVDRLNAELATGARHRIAAENALTGPGGAPLTDETTWADVLRGDATPAGITAGEVLTISGTRGNGSTFLVEYRIDDPATQTVGELRALIEQQFGGAASVYFDDGVLTVEMREQGASRATLAISSENPGSAGLFGPIEVVTEGRSPATVRATVEDGQIRIAHDHYGSHAGFVIAFEAGGADGTSSLGLAAGEYRGDDVQGTIGGMAATGTARTLTGASGTDVEGLSITYSGSDTGSVGTITFSRGIAGAVARVADVLLGIGEGSIQSVIDGLDRQVRQLNERIERLDARLERRREDLIRRFVALESALARAQSQSQWLAMQLAQIPGLRT